MLYQLSYVPAGSLTSGYRTAEYRIAGAAVNRFGKVGWLSA